MTDIISFSFITTTNIKIKEEMLITEYNRIQNELKWAEKKIGMDI
jgi:hypothetical protein